MVQGKSSKADKVAEYVYPVRVRVFIPKVDWARWSQRYSHIHAWLDQHCGRSRYWVGSGHAPGQDDSVMLYLQSADIAKRIVDDLAFRDQVKCQGYSSSPHETHIYKADD